MLSMRMLVALMLYDVDPKCISLSERFVDQSIWCSNLFVYLIKDLSFLSITKMLEFSKLIQFGVILIKLLLSNDLSNELSSPPDASFANLSAISLPQIPECAFTLTKSKLMFFFFFNSIILITKDLL